MIYFLEILSWFFIGFGLITAAVKYLNYSTPKHYLTWFGGVVFLGLIISQLILLPVPSTVLGNLENIIQIISGNVFYRIIYLLVSISLWTFWGLIIWYILLRLVPRKFLTYLGFLVVIYLSVVSPYFLLLKARYQISDWNVVLTDLISHISLQSHSDDRVSLCRAAKAGFAIEPANTISSILLVLWKLKIDRYYDQLTNFWNWSEILISGHTIVNEPVLKTFYLLLTFIYSMPFFIREVILMFSLHKSVFQICSFFN